MSFSPITLTSSSALQTQEIAKTLWDVLDDFPTTIGFCGEVGAGKTHFIQGFLQQHVSEPITSPTYSIIQQYALPDHYGHHDTLPVCSHIDCYRIPEHIADVLESSKHDAIRLIEWCDITADLKPDILVTITINKDESRTITIEAL